MKAILITGGAGFIGKNLILYLRSKDINESRQIIVIDNFKTSSRKDFESFVNNLDVKLYESDINITEPNVFSMLENVQIDQVYHLASIASPPLYKKFPLDTLDVGYIGTRNVMTFAIQAKARVLFASSSEVYGEADISPQHEDYYGNTNVFGERSSYDCSKRIGEALMYTFQKSFGADIRIARIFNTYGPHMNLDDGRLITEIIKSILFKKPMIIYGDGAQTRSMCFVTDTVSMLYRLMNSSCNTPVNIGNNNEMSVMDITRSFSDSVKIEYEYRPLTQNDPLHRCPDLTKNKDAIGLTEYTSLADGLSKTLEYFVNFFVE